MTSTGEPLRSQDLVFDVLDRDALTRALSSSRAFEYDESAKQYVWLGGVRTRRRLGVAASAPPLRPGNHLLTG